VVTRFELLDVMFFATILAFVGVVCLFYPEQFQRRMVKWTDKGIISRFSPRYAQILIRSSQYIVVLRLVGSLALLGCAFVIVALLFGKKQ
jgi:hypothetical protein